MTNPYEPPDVPSTEDGGGPNWKLDWHVLSLILAVGVLAMCDFASAMHSGNSFGAELQKCFPLILVITGVWWIGHVLVRRGRDLDG